MKIILKFVVLIWLSGTCLINSSFAQISPGDLAKVHSHLEGMSNCTKCHTIGAKVSNDKCLACHTEINERIRAQKGYHSSSAVKGKECASCHNDHHGKNFQIIRFKTTEFQHTQAGYKLEGAHAKKDCKDCHQSKFITNTKLKTKTNTYLGLNTECLSCHTDYHQKTLTGSCFRCHSTESFKPATKFNHKDAKFPLIGQHLTVACSKCHPTETREGKTFQKFTGLKFNNCTSCHTDPHENKFGQNCKQCHSEVSFHTIKNNKSFDHSSTGFQLEGMHANVSCTACHKRKLTDPLKHDNCTDCHPDYHKGQFAKSGISPDCIECHTVQGFSPSNFTIDKHNQCKFKLTGSHLAVACTDCHKKQGAWNFRQIGQNCSDCHQDIHKNYISQKYYPNGTCNSCHTDIAWNNVKFDHSKTNFKLTGAHTVASCRSCHFNKDKTNKIVQKFSGLATSCNVCHNDNHNRQFDKNGVTDCSLCHESQNWKAKKFDHNKTGFKLDGQHENLECSKCHKPDPVKKYVIYKIKDYRCEACHK
ncbi:MAG: cytochrome C [Bacteroidales bacterium]